MAKNTEGQDPEEEKKDQFEDDEDFGLPDLEYDELDDGDEEFEDEMEAPAVESTPEPPADVPEPVSEEVEVPKEDVEKELADLEKESGLEVKEEESGLSLGESEPESEATTATPEKKEEPSEFYQEESFDDFKDTDSIFGADTGSGKKTGLTDSEKQLFDKTVPDALTQRSNKGRFTKIVILGAVVFTVIAALLVFMYGGVNEPRQEEAKVEKKAPPPPPVVKEEEPEEEEATPIQAPAETAQAPAATPSQVDPGQISRLDERTGNSYIVIASFFDEDLAQDHASELAADGKSPYIIPPFAEHKFFRVAIAEFGSFGDAQQNLGSYTGEYGPDIWALRY